MIKLLRLTIRLLFNLSCIAVALYAFFWLYRQANPADPFHVKFATEATAAVPLHFIGGGLALLLVPLQLSGWVRRKAIGLHQAAGGAYVAGVIIGGCAGLALAQNAHGGTVAEVGFSLLSLIWLTTTGLAVAAIRRGDVAAHRRWMFRSVALTTSAVTLRIMLGIGVAAMALPFDQVYVFASWGCWLFNLAVCELALKRGQVTLPSRGAVRFPGVRNVT